MKLRIRWHMCAAGFMTQQEVTQGVDPNPQRALSKSEKRRKRKLEIQKLFGDNASQLQPRKPVGKRHSTQGGIVLGRFKSGAGVEDNCSNVPKAHHKRRVSSAVGKHSHHKYRKPSSTSAKVVHRGSHSHLHSKFPDKAIAINDSEVVPSEMSVRKTSASLKTSGLRAINGGGAVGPPNRRKSSQEEVIRETKMMKWRIQRDMDAAGFDGLVTGNPSWKNPALKHKKTAALGTRPTKKAPENIRRSSSKSSSGILASIKSPASKRRTSKLNSAPLPINEVSESVHHSCLGRIYVLFKTTLCLVKKIVISE